MANVYDNLRRAQDMPFEDYEDAFTAGWERVRQELATLRPPESEVDRERIKFDSELKERYEELMQQFRRKQAELPPGADETEKGKADVGESPGDYSPAVFGGFSLVPYCLLTSS